MNLVDKIAQKVQRLPLEKQVEVHDFVDFLIERMLRDARRLQSFADSEPSLSPIQTQPVDAPRPLDSTAPPKTQDSPVVSVSSEQALTSMIRSHQSPRFQSTPPPVLMEKRYKTTQGQQATAGVVTAAEDLPEVTVAEMEEAAGELESFWSSWDKE